jgi:hypothetical protein
MLDIRRRDFITLLGGVGDELGNGLGWNQGIYRHDKRHMAGALTEGSGCSSIG